MIDDDMCFLTLKGFCRKAEYIKEKYHTLSLHDRWEYKYYVYSNYMLSRRTIDKIWEYLNEPEGSFYCVPLSSLLFLSKKE